MFLLKQCPRCNGDLSTDRDQYGQFISCLQCGLCEDIEISSHGAQVVGLNSVQVPAGSSGEESGINASRPLISRLSTVGSP